MPGSRRTSGSGKPRIPSARRPVAGGEGSEQENARPRTLAVVLRPVYEDATWDSPGLGRFEGREAIRGFFRRAAGIFSFAIHYSLNGQIHVDGDTARAQWYLFMPC